MSKDARVLARLEREQRKRGFSADLLCFDRQLAFVEDQARFKVAVCSRRAGKTVACAILLLGRALAHARTNHLYVTLSRINAKRIVWRQLLDLNRQHALGGVPNETELTILFPNGSVVYLSGAKDSGEVEKFRGLSIKTVVIDEAQSFRPYLKTLIDDVLVPCLWDVQGELVLIGTPGPVKAGTFWEAYSGKSWSAHHWTIIDNPHILRLSGKTPEVILEEERARRGIGEEDPTYQRESLGRWVNDFQSLVFHYDSQRNGFAHLPDGVDDSRRSLQLSRYVLGVDVGHDDADAIAALGWSEASPDLYLCEEHVQTKASVSDLADAIGRFRDKYSPERIVMDFGGLGKKMSVDIRQRWGIPVEPAEKSEKLRHIELLNDALRTGRFRARTESRFAQDCVLVQWDQDARAKGTLRVSDAYHSDITDAVLYAYRAAQHYQYEPAKPKPTAIERVDLWEQEQLEAVERRAGMSWMDQDAEKMGFG